ncbi:YSIRK-type signal peptide-containing protein [Helcococcus ovis]|uniref:transglutaminase domain-containing protein n=1 Tax=Helcococcus ovis TaxID=72026 RepID=UPI0038B75C5F
MRKYGMRKLSVGLVSVVLGVLLLPNIVVQGGNNRYISSSIYASDEMHVKKDKFKPSQELLDYLRKPIPYDKPTQAPDGVLSVNETQEYVIKAIMEQQPTVIFYGPDGFDKKVLEEVLYTPSYGSLIKHIYGKWKTDKEEVNFEKGIYRYITRFNYATLKEDVMRAEKYLDEVAKWLQKKLDEEYKLKFKNTPDSEDFKKALIIHDFIVKNVKGDSSVEANKVTQIKSKEKNDNKTYEVHTLPAAIFGEKTVCQGYAMLFDRLAYKMGLESRILRGQSIFLYWNQYDQNQEKEKRKLFDEYKSLSKNGKEWKRANHMWNQVKIDGKWYHLDLTYDAISSRRNNKYMYDRFLISDAILKKEVKKQSGVQKQGKDEWQRIEYIDPILWNEKEAESVLNEYNSGKLYYKFQNDSQRQLHSDNIAIFSQLDKDSEIHKDMLDFNIKNNIEYIHPVSQITLGHKKNETINLLVGTKLEDLPKKLGATIIKSTNSNKILELGNVEKIDVLAKSTNNNYDELSNISGKEVEIELYNDNVEVKSKKVKVRFLSKDKMPKPEAFIFTMNGYDNISIDQYHHSNSNLANDYNKKEKEKRIQELKNKILSTVSASNKNISKTNRIKMDILGIDKVNFSKPGEYTVLVVAAGNDNLRVKKEIPIKINATQKENRIKIYTKDNKINYSIETSSIDNNKKNFKQIIDSLVSPEAIFEEFGQKKKLAPKMYLIDINNVKWIYDEEKDNFINTTKSDNLFTERYKVKTMKEMIESNVCFSLIFELSYDGDIQTSNIINVNFINSSDVVNSLETEDAIKKFNKSNLSLSEIINNIDAIKENKSKKHLDNLLKGSNIETVDMQLKKYKVIHKNNGKVLFEVEKLGYNIDSYVEKASDYYIEKYGYPTKRGRWGTITNDILMKTGLISEINNIIEFNYTNKK